MDQNNPLYEYFQIILKKVPEDQRDFLTNVRSNSRNHTSPSIEMLIQLHKQVKKDTSMYIFNFNLLFELKK